jgi:hypothetical protein
MRYGHCLAGRMRGLHAKEIEPIIEEMLISHDANVLAIVVECIKIEQVVDWVVDRVHGSV